MASTLHHDPLQRAFGFSAALEQRRSLGLMRERAIQNGAQGPVVTLGNGVYLNFSSNDYLGLAADPRVTAALKAAADQYGVGAGASALMGGWRDCHARLEDRIARFTGRDRALLFPSGYMANLALGLCGLVGPGGNVVADRLAHASLIDAARASGARLRRYPHLDATAAERALAVAVGRTMLVTDGVFSMDGDIAPVAALAGICSKYSALLVVDDAHGIGVLGDNGGGVLALTHASQADVPFLVGTFGKAFGAAGAFIAGADGMIEYLLQHARTHMFTTAMPPAVAAAALRAVEIASEEHWRREELSRLIDYFRAGAGALGLPLLPSRTPIQPVLVGSAEEAVAISGALRAVGVIAPAARPPSVPQQRSRLRISLTAAHTREHVDRLLEGLGQIFEARGRRA